MDPLEKLLNPILAALRGLCEVDLRCAEQPQAAGDLAPQVIPGVFERIERAAVFRFRSPERDQNVYVAAVRRQVSFGYRDTDETGVLELVPDKFSDFFPQRLGDALRTTGFHAAIPTIPL
jgi:hypothetical protein